MKKLKNVQTLLFLMLLGVIAVQLLNYSDDYQKLHQDINENGVVFYDEAHKLKIRIAPDLKTGDELSEQAVIERYINLIRSIEVYNKNVMLRLVALCALCFLLGVLLIVNRFAHEIKRESEENGHREVLARKEQVLYYYAQLSSVGQVAGNIIHQWKQPLNNLMLIVSNIEDSIGEADYELLGELSRDAREAVKLLSGTISDFRGLFVTEVIDSIFDVQNLVINVKNLFANKLDGAGITCTVICEGNLRLRGKKSQLMQVLINLIDNACDAVIGREIFDGQISVVCTEEAGGISIRVSDNGGGIPGEMQPHIFDACFTSKGSKGSGLGLTISRDIIANYFNGTITFDNLEDGARFQVFIPRFGGDAHE